jgi:hypothetical protein
MFNVSLPTTPNFFQDDEKIFSPSMGSVFTMCHNRFGFPSGFFTKSKAPLPISHSPMRQTTNPLRPAPASLPQKGFALIATLTVTALVTLLVLALLSLSNQARQPNAPLSMMLAPGELQRQVGPDSRITAPSDTGTLTDGRMNRFQITTANTNPGPRLMIPSFRWLDNDGI